MEWKLQTPISQNRPVRRCATGSSSVEGFQRVLIPLRVKMASQWNRALFPFSLFIKAIQCFACLFLSSLLGLPYGCKKKIKLSLVREKKWVLPWLFLWNNIVCFERIHMVVQFLLTHKISCLESVFMYHVIWHCPEHFNLLLIHVCFLCMGTIGQMALLFIFPLFLLLIVMLLL